MDRGWHVVARFLYNFDESWQGFVQGDIVVFSYGMGQRGPQAQSPASWSKNAATEQMHKSLLQGECSF